MVWSVKHFTDNFHIHEKGSPWNIGWNIANVTVVSGEHEENEGELVINNYQCKQCVCFEGGT